MTKRAASDLPVSPASSEAILESISDGVFTVDPEWRITSFNRAAERITGVPREEAIGRRCADVFRSSTCGPSCALQRTLRTGRPVIGRSTYIVVADGTRVPVSLSTAVLRDAKGRVTGGAEIFRDLSEVEALREELEGRSRVGDLATRSPLMQRVLEALPAIAASPSTVLLLGETGTGKELVARTIHALSPRANESELFGHTAGAFTGAVKERAGRFALAQGGTLFLDEIGEVSPALQVRLLRVLQERTYEPLGSSRAQKTDARVVVATNRDLAARVREGLFREDLYYRVNVVRIELPPLRSRKEDVPLLVEELVARFNRLQGRAVKGITAEALSLLMAHDWPGNVRELANVVERAFVVCGERRIDLGDLPDELAGRHRPSAPELDVRSAHAVLDGEAIRAALERHRFNRLEAARELGIHKTTLFRRIRKLGIELPGQDGRSARTDTE